MTFETSQLLLAFGLTALAGLSTGVGSALAFFTRRSHGSFLSSALGFSGGVMIYVSFLDELLPTAREYGKPHQVIYGVMAGMIVMAASLLLL